MGAFGSAWHGYWERIRRDDGTEGTLNCVAQFYPSDRSLPVVEQMGEVLEGFRERLG